MAAHIRRAPAALVGETDAATAPRRLLSAADITVEYTPTQQRRFVKIRIVYGGWGSGAIFPRLPIEF